MSDTEARQGEPLHGRYRHAVEALRKPWAIVEETFDVVCSIVAMRAAGERLTHDEISARIGAARRETRTVRETGSVAVIPVYGVIYPKASLMTEVSGATSVTMLQAQLREAVADPSVTSILLDVDSPGGVTDLVPELADEIRDARKSKRVVAVANTDAGSAAYWLASQASEVVVTPSGQVGSVGVFMAHVDRSGQMEREGLRHTIVSAGKFKVERANVAPLSEEAVAAMQGEVDEFYDMFVRAVAKGRGVSVDTVRQGFGEGRMVAARRALEAGMVDRVDTFDATLARMIREDSRRGSAGAVSLAFNPASAPTATSVVHTTFSTDTTSPVAADGRTFTDEAEELRASAAHLVDRTRSLAEVRDRGRLTAAKREQLAACTAGLRSTVQELEQLLADTDPARHQAEIALAEAKLALLNAARTPEETK